MTLLEQAEEIRSRALDAIGYDKLDVNEQFFTPLKVAQLMADFLAYEEEIPAEIHLLDPGAGSGILTVAAVEKIKELSPNTKIRITAVEKDPLLLEVLKETFSEMVQFFKGVDYEIINENFLYWATQEKTLFGLAENSERFDLIIQNPPYSKLPATGAENKHLRKCGIHTPNIYAAFMALGERLLNENGKMISITPRSWMNGTYFAKFRQELFKNSYLVAIHTFESRREVFKDTGVLQEAIITSVIKTKKRLKGVLISSSKSQAHDTLTRWVPYSSVFVNGVIFVPATDEDAAAVLWMSKARCQLAELGIGVSTGKVVAFRNRRFLTDIQGPQTVPMVYAENFRAGNLTHPAFKSNKPQFYQPLEASTDKKLIPPGVYVLVKRFSSKEEKRRITAAIWNSDTLAAFDNKTNFFHVAGRGLQIEVAEGLCKWLNSSYADNFFRVFSGHTQVNAGDLRIFPYPTLEELKAIAKVDASPDDSIEAILN